MPGQKKIDIELPNGVKLEMVRIPAGGFLMGSLDAVKDAQDDEKPQRWVWISRPFYMGKYPVTQEQWQAVMRNNPSSFQCPKNPVEQVSYSDCKAFLGTLNANFSGGYGEFVLPTEAQWEYACRAGSTARYCFGDDESQLGKYAWYATNAGGHTHPVGEKQPNAWGLYDMHGNVSQWCAERHDARGYLESGTDDPRDPRRIGQGRRATRGDARSGGAMRGERLERWRGLLPLCISRPCPAPRPRSRRGPARFLCDVQRPRAPVPLRLQLIGPQFVEAGKPLKLAVSVENPAAGGGEAAVRPY